MQILCTLRDVNFFVGLPIDLLPHSVAKIRTISVNAHHYTEGGSHWLAIGLTPRSSKAYYFDSYGI